MKFQLRATVRVAHGGVQSDRTSQSDLIIVRRDMDMSLSLDPTNARLLYLLGLLDSTRRPEKLLGEV